MKTKLPDRYEHDGTSAKGGFGEILFCVDKHLDRRVAIKFIQNAEDANRLRDEISALLQLRSKHVVQVFDLIVDDGDFGIVEEFVDGESLTTTQYPRSSTDNYLKILWQIASGLADIHGSRIIHRDIKPENMKLDAEKILKILDFGLARKEGTDAKTRGFVGSFGFAAPELFQDDTATFSRAIDVYAFGAVACFLATGDLPKELKENAPKAIASNGLSFGSFSAPTEVISLILRCLAQIPEDRPPMAEVRDELASHILRDKHRALVVYSGDASELNKDSRRVGLGLDNVGEIVIEYDGLRFVVKSTRGDVFINNQAAVTGMALPGSCVVALGDAQKHRRQRAFITFDVSNPEVTI